MKKKCEVFLWDILHLLAMSVIHTVPKNKFSLVKYKVLLNVKKTETTGGMQCAVQEKILWEMKALSLFFLLEMATD